MGGVQCVEVFAPTLRNHTLNIASTMRRPLTAQPQRRRLMPPDGLVPMESAGSTRRCGQPMDSPNGIFCDHDFPPTFRTTSSVPACPQPPHNLFGQVRYLTPTLVSNHRLGNHLPTQSWPDGGLPHSPSSELNQHTRAALSTGQNTAVENESGKTNQENAVANHTPA